MRVIQARNVNVAFYEGMHLLDECGVQEKSRAGLVDVVPHPVMTIYEQPCERVLFDPARDANPFFHLMEGLWMLAGRDDSAMLDRYVSNFGERFADKGIIHGAYGKRWRSALGYDQLDAIVAKLRNNPQDRQCVLQMWDMRQGDNLTITDEGCNDLLGDWKDRPCNTHVYFRVRQIEAARLGPSSLQILHGDRVIDEYQTIGDTVVSRSVLDMTICCRSNDAVWGAHGANAVHFSMLQEYLSGRIGVSVGTMYQFSSNYHGYVDALKKIGDPTHLSGADPYETGEVHSVAMAGDWSEWDRDLSQFMSWHDQHLGNVPDDEVLDQMSFSCVNLWFRDVACRVALARWQWTHAMKLSACKTAEQITAPDWRRACLEWMDRRTK